MKIESVKVGEQMPVLDIDVTAKLIVGGAIESRDYQNVHHDKDAAQALGSPDIFMNILTTNGLVGRYLTDWAGQGARMKKIAILLGAPNYPGDTMQLTGVVSAVDRETGSVNIDIEGVNRYGHHVTGSAELSLPG